MSKVVMAHRELCDHTAQGLVGRGTTFLGSFVYFILKTRKDSLTPLVSLRCLCVCFLKCAEAPFFQKKKLISRNVCFLILLRLE